MALFQCMMATDRFKEANALAARLWERGDKSSPHQKSLVGLPIRSKSRHCGYDEQAVELDQVACEELKSLWVTSLNATWLEQMRRSCWTKGGSRRQRNSATGRSTGTKNSTSATPQDCRSHLTFGRNPYQARQEYRGPGLLNESIAIRKQKLPAGDKTDRLDESRLKTSHQTARMNRSLRLP